MDYTTNIQKVSSISFTIFHLVDPWNRPSLNIIFHIFIHNHSSNNHGTPWILWPHLHSHEGYCIAHCHNTLFTKPCFLSMSIQNMLPGIGFTIHCTIYYHYEFLKMKIWVKLFVFLTIQTTCQGSLIFDVWKVIGNNNLETIKDFIYHNFD